MQKVQHSQDPRKHTQMVKRKINISAIFNSYAVLHRSRTIYKSYPLIKPAVCRKPNIHAWLWPKQNKTSTAVCATLRRVLCSSYTSIMFFPNPFGRVKTMALEAKGNVFKGSCYRRHQEMRPTGNTVAPREAEGNKLCLDATVRGWKICLKEIKKKEKTLEHECGLTSGLLLILIWFLRKANGMWWGTHQHNAALSNPRGVWTTT